MSEDDIAVSREALAELWDAWRFKRSVLSIETGRAVPAALSQPPAQPPVYVCPQCGPDPAGAADHAERRHTIAGLLGEQEQQT